MKKLLQFTAFLLFLLSCSFLGFGQSTSTINVSYTPTGFAGSKSNIIYRCAGSALPITLTVNDGGRTAGGDAWQLVVYDVNDMFNQTLIANVPAGTINGTFPLPSSINLPDGDYEFALVANVESFQFRATGFTLKTITSSATIGGNTDFCRGGNVTQTATPTPLTIGDPEISETAFAKTYQWRDGSNVLNTNSLTYTPTLAGTYDFVYSITNTTAIITNSGTCTSTTPTTITGATPTITGFSRNPNSICAGQDFTLSATVSPSGGTYDWVQTQGTGSFSSTDQSPTINKPSGFYNFSLTYSLSGCTTSASVGSFSVNPTPATPTNTANQTACLNATSVTLLGNCQSGETIQWFWNQGTSVSTLLASNVFTVPTASVGTAQTYDFSANCKSGSCESRFVNISVQTSGPAAPVASGASVCTGGRVTLTATGCVGGTLTWYNATPPPAPLSGPSPLAVINPSVTMPVGVGSYYATCTQANCVSANSNTVQVTQNATPTISAIFRNPNSICAGQDFTLSATVSPLGGTYDWVQTQGTGSFSSSSASPTINKPSGFYNFGLTYNVGGCTASAATGSFSVNQTPSTPTSNGATICSGSSTTLSISNCTGSSTVTWYASNDPLDVTVLARGSYSTPNLTASTTYYASCQLLSCESARGAVPVTVISTATPVAVGGTICPGQTTVLTTTSCAVANQTWYQVLSNGNGKSYSPVNMSAGVGVGTYVVECSNGNCISPKSNEVDVTESSKIVITIAPVNINSGNTATLVAVGCTGGTVTWYASSTSPSILFTGASFTTPVLTGNATYYAVCAISGSCTSDRTLGTVNVNTDPCLNTTLLANAGVGGSFTGTQTYNLAGVTTASGGTAPYTYSWTTNPSGVAINTTTFGATTANPIIGVFSQNTTVNLSVRDANSCLATSSASINFANCTLSASVTGTGTLCAGGSSSLTLGLNVSGTSPSSSLTYQWSRTVGSITTALGTSSTQTATAAGSYQCLITDNFTGCTYPANGTVAASSLGTPTIPVPANILGIGSTTLTLQGCNGTSVAWYNAVNTLLQSGLSYTTTSLTTTTSYYAICSDATCSTRADVTVTVIPAPNAPSVTSAEICGTGTGTLSASGCGGTVNWYDAATGGTSLGSGTSFTTPVKSITTDFFAECVVNGAASLTRGRGVLTVKAFPFAAINHLSNLQFCEGGSTKLTATNDLDVRGYQWKRNGVNINGANNRDYIATQSGSYTVVNSNDGCSRESAPKVVDVVAILKAPIITPQGPTGFCPGNGVQITSNVSGQTVYEYRWYRNGTRISTASAYGADQGGNYDLRIVNALGCESPASNIVAVTVYPVPNAPKIYIDGLNKFCDNEGRSSTLSTDAAASYEWTNFDGTRYTSQNVPNLTKYSIFTLKVKNQFGCVSPPSVYEIVVFKAPDAPTIIPDGAVTLCLGKSVKLTSSQDGANYEWSSGEKTKTITPDVSKVGTLRYTLKITDGNGCTSKSSENVSVTINPNPAKPVISADGKLTFCDIDQTNLTSTQEEIYLWNNGEKTRGIKPRKSGTYSLNVTNKFGCVSPESDPTVIVVNPSPVPPKVTINGLSEFCADKQTELLSTDDGTVTEYLWNADANNATTSKIIVKKAGLYFLSVKNKFGCSVKSNEVAIKVNPLPAKPVISASGAITFCDGGDVTLTSTQEKIYDWNSKANTRTIKVTKSGSFTVIVTNEFGCISPISDALVVTVNPNPDKPVITPDGALIFCADSKVNLTSSTEAKYKWSTGETSKTITIDKDGTFTVQVTNQFGCISPISEPIITEAKPLPATPTLARFGAFNLRATSSGPVNGYEWKSGSNTFSEKGDILKAATDAPYTTRSFIIYKIPTGELTCFSQPANFQFSADPDLKGFAVFPNPSKGSKITIETQQNLKNVRISLYDRLGRRLFLSDLIQTIDRQYELTLTLNQLIEGDYILLLEADNYRATRWVLIDR
jgi:large repetitive protein